MMPLFPACPYSANNAVRSTSSLMLFARRHFSVNATRGQKPSGGTAYKIRDIREAVSVSRFQELVFKTKQESYFFPGLGQTDPAAALPRAHNQLEIHPVVLPALEKWFTYSKEGERERADLSPYFKEHATGMLPYELLLPSTDLSSPPNENLSHFISWLLKSSDPSYQILASFLKRELAQQLASLSNEGERLASNPDTFFIRFEAPLALLAAGVQFNKEQPSPDRCFTQLYVAQAPLPALPKELQADVPTPMAVVQSGAGDVYGSSIWLGLEPTYTPWHRDPNPNLFCQLCGSKVLRIMPSGAGLKLFEEVQARMGRAGSPSIRGEEMMQGAERQAWLDAVWGKDAPSRMLEVIVKPSDVLFIPKGWWHSVKSMGPGGELNASVNWWFRFKALDEEVVAEPYTVRKRGDRASS
jgi:hypothetical protein